jgi:hypothetical protein
MNYKRYYFGDLYKTIYATGDIHGSFDILLYHIIINNIENSVVIITGDCGFGFETEEYYIHLYNKELKKALKKQNVIIICVRGNHDDIKYFDGDKINFPYLKAVPDYSILSFANNFNILCVGGAISIDRTFRNSSTYFPNEEPIYEPDILNKISQDNIIISSVITHTCPSFCPPYTKDGIKNYLLIDPKLEKDITNERKTLTDLYLHLININNQPIESWFYGHFHFHQMTYFNNIKFLLLDCIHTYNNGIDISIVKEL